MRIIFGNIVFVLLMAICAATQTPQVPGSGDSGPDDQGNLKFAVQKKQYYLGCWQPRKEFKTNLERKPDFFRITWNTIQTSEMPHSVPYVEVNEGVNKEYFVLKLDAKDKSGRLNRYMYLLMVLDVEMLVYGLDEFALDQDLKERSKDHWNIKKIDCSKVNNKFPEIK